MSETPRDSADGHRADMPDESPRKVDDARDAAAHARIDDERTRERYDAAPPHDVATPARRRGGGWLAALLLLVVLGIAGWLGWREWQRMQAAQGELDAWRGATARIDERIAELEQRLGGEIESLRRNQRALTGRLDDATDTNRVLREELLAIAERAALLEDAMSRFSQERLLGERLMKLNEAEFVLTMAAERLRLFGDVEAALAAYDIADDALASVDDPLAASVRETLAQERAEIAALPRDAVARALSELSAASAALPSLPVPTANDAADAEPSRLRELLSQVVTVRRVGESARALDPVRRDAELAALRLDLSLARGAVERRDHDSLDTALDRARDAVTRLFDTDAPAVQRVLQRLEDARDVELDVELPALGATLSELRGLRAARAGNAIQVEPIGPPSARDDGSRP